MWPLILATTHTTFVVNVMSLGGGKGGGWGRGRGEGGRGLHRLGVLKSLGTRLVEMYVVIRMESQDGIR